MGRKTQFLLFERTIMEIIRFLSHLHLKLSQKTNIDNFNSSCFRHSLNRKVSAELETSASKMPAFCF